MRSHVSSSLLALGLVLSLAGCPTATDQRAQEGVDALNRCDLREAHDAFADARDMDGSRADVALAFALTDLATLVEDPALSAIAPRLGFDRPLDSSLAWGPNGLLDRLSRSDDCDTLSPWFHETFPHASARTGGPEFWSTVDTTLTLGEVRDVLVALSPRLTGIARALEQAAENLEDEGVTLSGGCGLSARPTRLQAPELLALATALDAVVAVVEVARGYDGSIPFHILFRGAYGREAAWAAAMNDGFLVPTDPAPVASGRAMLHDAVSLGLRAVAAARTERGRTHPSDAIFDWTAMPIEVLDDAETFGTAGATALATDGMTAIPRLTPALAIDVGSFFTPAFDGSAEGPLWSVETDSFGTFVRTDGEAFQRLLASHFDSDPWSETAPSRSFMVDWSEHGSATWERFFDPGDRWSMAYACE